MTKKVDTPSSPLAAPAVILDRRRFIKASTALAGVFIASGATIGLPRRAYALDKVVHQLGWIKSIQFGGHFARHRPGLFRR